jgi:hypothetical protein
MKQIIKKSFCFIANKAGVVSIEIAFIASSFILLIMGIVEYSVIFSLRGGLEEISRGLSRERQAVSEGEDYNNWLIKNNLTRFGADARMTMLTVQKIRKIVPNPHNIRVNMIIYNKTGDIVNDIEQTNKTFNFIKDQWIIHPGQYLKSASHSQYVRYEIKYKHDFITPIGYIYSSLAGSVEFSTVSYFRKETLFNEDV